MTTEARPNTLLKVTAAGFSCAMCIAKGGGFMPAPMTREERETFLADVHVGVLSVDEPGRGPLSVPVWYVYEPGGEIVMVTRPEARKARLTSPPSREG